VDRRASMFFQNVNLNEMVMCLEDLINYFAQPEDDMGKKKTFFLLQISLNHLANDRFFQNTKRNRTSFELSGIVRIYFKRRVYLI